MTEPTPKATKTARKPYDSIPKPQMRTIDPCVRVTDLVIPGMNKRIEDPDA